jgi:hypothetical protein
MNRNYLAVNGRTGQGNSGFEISNLKYQIPLFLKPRMTRIFRPARTSGSNPTASARVLAPGKCTIEISPEGIAGYIVHLQALAGLFSASLNLTSALASPAILLGFRTEATCDVDDQANQQN